MDGTLIRDADSVKYLCMLNNNLEEAEKIEFLEEVKQISWIDADYLKAELIEGLDLSEVEYNFNDRIKLIQNIEPVMTFLKEKGIKSVLITSGSIQVAEILAARFGFDAVYGSQYEIRDQKFTGKITTHLNNKAKLDCLKEFCAKNDIDPDNCIAVGDSDSDVDIFGNCGKSIAINYSEALKAKASEYVITDDLSDIISIIDSWLSG